MSVRKRKWTTGKGVEKEAWIVDYVDGEGARRLKTFDKKREADAFAATTSVEVREGTHVAESRTVSVKEAGEKWLISCESAGLERATLDQYRQHYNLHIVPFLGRTLLSKLGVPSVRAFQDKLREEGRSPAMVKRVTVSLGSIVADAQERGLTARNPVREMSKRRGRATGKAERRQKARLRVGIDIPTPAEIGALLGAAEGRYRPFLVTAVFTGMRASELRGLRWAEVDLNERVIHVRQRADKYHEIGMPKSDAGQRTIPIGPMVVNTLREWQLACPRPFNQEKDAAGDRIRQSARPEHFVFPNGEGNIEWHANIIKRGLIPPQIKAGLVVETGEKDEEGKPIVEAKYTGLHSLRHFFASWCINLPQHGGLGLPPKVVQERMGHSSITMTMDVYGHLFPNTNDSDALAAAELKLLSSANAT